MKDQSHTFQRWFSYLAEFHFTIKFRLGKLNINADSLSRLPPLEKPDGMEPDEFVMRMVNKPEAKYLFEFGINSIWGEGWWAEIEKAQDDEICPVMVWLQHAVGELSESKAAPQPDPSENKQHGGTKH